MQLEKIQYFRSEDLLVNFRDTIALLQLLHELVRFDVVLLSDQQNTLCDLLFRNFDAFLFGNAVQQE